MAAGLLFLLFLGVNLRYPFVSYKPNFSATYSFGLERLFKPLEESLLTLFFWGMSLLLMLRRSLLAEVTTTNERRWAVFYALSLLLGLPMQWRHFTVAAAFFVLTLLYNFIYTAYLETDNKRETTLTPMVSSTIGIGCCIMAILSPSALIFIPVLIGDIFRYHLFSLKSLIALLLGLGGTLFLLSPFCWSMLFGYSLFEGTLSFLADSNAYFSAYLTHALYTFTFQPIWQLSFVGNERFFFSLMTILATALIASNAALTRNFNNETKRKRELSAIDLRLLLPLLLGVFFLPFLYDCLLWITLPLAFSAAYGNGRRVSSLYRTTLIFVIGLFTVIQYLFFLF